MHQNSEEAKFKQFMRDHQRDRDASLVRELIGNALENGHIFEGWSNEELVDDMLAYADFEIERHVGPIDADATRSRLLNALDYIRHEIR